MVGSVRRCDGGGPTGLRPGHYHHHHCGHLVYALVRRNLQERLSKSSAKALARLLEYAIIAIGLYFAFWQVLDVDITGALISLGIIGIALAFASQQIVQNAFAGILFSVTRPMQMEDWVEVGGTPTTGLCRVKDITLIHTVLRDVDGRLLYVPNSFILNNKLINFTKAGFVAVPFQIRLISPNDYDKVKRIILEEADHDPYILPNVNGEEKKAIDRVLEMTSFRALYSGGSLDMSHLPASIPRSQ